MDREQLKAALREIEMHAAGAENSAASARDIARRIFGALKEKPDPVEPPVVEPGPTGIGVGSNNGVITINLPPESRASLAQNDWIKSPFIELFRTEAGGVQETVVVLHNGNPQGNGAIRIQKLEIRTHGGRSIFDWQGPVTIEPGGMLVVRDYRVVKGRDLGEANAQCRFWGKALEGVSVAPSIIAGAKASDLHALDALLFDEHKRQVANPVTVGPYDVMWDEEGARGGGQGIEPYRFDWRRWFTGARALAALEMYRVANRTSRCMTDESGAFTWDRTVTHESTGSIMPAAFNWTPDDEVEAELKSWKNIDGQHFIRAYLAALFVAKETRHPFALWYLDMLANWQEAVQLGTAGDEASSQFQWSLLKKVSAFRGPNRHCGRALAHEFRFWFEYKRLNPAEGRADRISSAFMQLLLNSANENGVPLSMKASAITAHQSLSSWAGDQAAQAFELQLVLLAMEDSGYRPLVGIADKLHDFLGPKPPYVYNWTKGEASGKAVPYLELATHGHYDGSLDDLLKVSIERMRSQGPEANGANPLNYLNPRRGIVS